jgi:RND family efflux transporter MFP subunit
MCSTVLTAAGMLGAAVACGSCTASRGPERVVEARSPVTVGTVVARIHPLSQHLTVSSELVPFQEIDVYAKEAGYVKQLFVDYGSKVRRGQLMAILEIPELELQLEQDKAAIHAQADEVVRAEHEISRVKAQHEALHLQHERLAGVAKSKPGLVAQQEVDDAMGKDLAAESQLEATQGEYQAAQSQLVVAKAKLARDQALYQYSRITAPFDGVVTQRYANLGALMQAGTTSTQATPLVRLSQVSLYRLVIPVPESYVSYIRIGDPVEVRVPSLNHSFAGKVTRFSQEVSDSTRTMHTEVDVPNPRNELVPGAYAEAVMTLNQRPRALTVPLQALNHGAQGASVLVVGRDNRVEEHQILLGVQTPNYAEVTSGLKEGEQVIVSDRSGLKPGESVRPQQVQAMVYEAAERE